MLTVYPAKKIRGFLLHDHENRYTDDASPFRVPTTLNSFVFSDINNLNLQPGVRSSPSIQLFQGNVQQAETHAAKWIVKRRGFSCDKAGGFLNEYNLRFFEAHENFASFFIGCMRSTYQTHFPQ